MHTILERSTPMYKVLLALVLFANMAFAQVTSAPTSVLPQHGVGEKLAYIVAFEGDPDFTGMTLFFYTESVPPDQAGLRQQFGISDTRKVGPGQFEVSGAIPDNVASGIYTLTDVQPRLAPSGVKDYDGKQFAQAFRVDNPIKYAFPPLKEIKPK
jgi:hypothetical protein